MIRRVLLAAVCVSALAILPASAGQDHNEGGKGEGFHHGGMFSELNLTQEQKEKLKSLHQDMKQQRETMFEKMKNLRQQIKDEIMKDTPNQQLLGQLADQSAQLHKEMTMQRFNHLLQMKSVLTKEQLEKLLDRDWGGPEGGPGPRPGCQKDGMKDGKHCPMANDPKCPMKGKAPGTN
jgi:Spy/CpxP family protein refolding chaperone